MNKFEDKNHVNSRNPIIAGILSILNLGLGQMYNGQPKKGIFFALSVIPIYFIIGYSGLLKSFYGLVICTFLVILYIIYVAKDAFNWAAKQNTYQLKPINSYKYYFGFIIGYNVLILTLPPFVRNITGYEMYAIPTPSMEPSLMIGDKIAATRTDPHEVEIGDIISFKLEDDQDYISRVIGLPGDKIEIVQDRVSINDQPENWEKLEVVTNEGFEYQKFKNVLPNGKVIEILKMVKYNGVEISDFEYSNLSEIVVPNRTVYVIGDNRNNSIDSRKYGAVAFENIDKKIHYIWWSKDKSRIGTNLD